VRWRSLAIAIVLSLLAGAIFDHASTWAAGPSAVYRRYFADGSTGPLFDTRFAIANPGTRAANVILTFARTDGRLFIRRLVVAPSSRTAFSPASMAGLEDAEFGTTVEADQPLIVDRTITWDSTTYAGRADAGAAAPSTTWFLADGATHSGSNLYYAIHNPGASPADVTIQYLLPSSQERRTKRYYVAPHSRSTVWVNEEARTDSRLSDLNNADVSAAVSSTTPIVVEKTMYMSRPGRTYGPALSCAAAPGVSTTWFFAEGATGSAFGMFLVMMNPADADALIDARYLLPSGDQVTRTYAVPARGRLPVRVDLEDPRLAGTQVAVILMSANGVGIVAERSMFWPGPAAGDWKGATASTGTTAAGSRWGIAAGEVGGPRHTRTEVLVANTSPTAGSVAVTLLFENGSRDRKVFLAGTMKRFTVDVGREFSSADGKRFAVVVESIDTLPADLVVEWSMYADGPDQGSTVGWSAPASPLDEAHAGSTTSTSDDAAASRGGVAGRFAAAEATPSPAGSFNIKVVTDASPDLSDMDSLIASTTSRWPTTDQKVWALFYWSHILKRQTPPITLHGFDVTDPIRNLVDYGYTMCSTTSGINQSLYDALGLEHQYWDICNHTVSAVQYDGKFHMIDTSMSNLVTLDDGVTLASVPEVAADSARLLREHSVYSTSPNGFLTGTDTGRHLSDIVSPEDGTIAAGFAADFCSNGLKYRDYYYNWNRGHRYVLNVREGESYTRYYRPLGTSADYWISSEKIANADPSTTFQIDPLNKFGLRGNGSWVFSPPLTTNAWSAAAYRSDNIVLAAGGLEPADPAQMAEIVYKVQAADVIASQSVQAQFSRTSASAMASIALSLNHGVTWQTIGDLGSTVAAVVPVTINLRDQVNGAYETLIRVQMTSDPASPAAIVLTGMTISTVTQVNAKALPRLNSGRNQVFIGEGDQSDSMVLWPDLRGTLWAKDAYDSSNIAAQAVNVPRKYSAVVYPSTLNQDAYLTYKMEAPTDITRLVYGARLYNSRAGSYIDFLHSFDNGATWIPSYRLSDTNKPFDVIHYETITNIPPGVRRVLFKYLIHNTSTAGPGSASGLYAVRMEADYQPPQGGGRPIDVTFRWKEVQTDRSLADRSFRQRVAAFPTTVTIDVGGSDHPVMESLKVNVEDPSDATPFGYGDGVDVGGERYVPMRRAEGTNVAVNKPYTASRPPSGFQSSAPAANTTILTDGIVGGPVTGSNYYWWGQCWSSGSTVDLQVDLGLSQSVSAFRAHMFGYPFWDALKGQVQDRVEILTSVDGIDFVSQGLLPTSLWKKDIPINYMLQDDETATGWNFEQTLASAVQARYVRYHITPRRNLCLSELQVFDRIDYQPFDLRIALPESVPPPANSPPSVIITSPQNDAQFEQPAPIIVAADAQDVDGNLSRVEFFSDATSIGIATAAPYQVTWANAPVGRHSLTAQATDAAGAFTASAPVEVTVVTPTTTPPGNGIDEIVLYAAASPLIVDGWSVIGDATAAGGLLLQNPDRGEDKVLTPLAFPPQAFELTFTADAGKPYRLWLRGKAQGDSYKNDSVFVQFDHSVDASGNPMWRTNGSSAASVIIEECDGCGLQGWGWADTGYGRSTPGPLVSFAQAGVQHIRIQAREDGLGIDQIVLSAVKYMSLSPGSTKDDTTILAATQPGTGPPEPINDVVLYPGIDGEVGGGWSMVADTTAADGIRLQNQNSGQPKLLTALAKPAQYFDVVFYADAGKPYHVWVRGIAQGNNYNNDSVFVQFDHSVDASGTPIWRIDTESGTPVILEDCSQCGVEGWGWADNRYGANLLGPDVYFGSSGLQRLRVQVREDGLGIDQIVLSAMTYLNASPGAITNDIIIVRR